jgi:hypothetical protein
VSVEWAAMKRSRATGRKAGDRQRRSGRGPWPRVEGAADDLPDIGWVEYGGELIWAVGYTAGGVPFGLRASEFDPADLTALGLPGLSTKSSEDADWNEAAGGAQ